MIPQEMIDVIAAYNDGKPIQYRLKNGEKWEDVQKPTFNFDRFDYRVKGKPKVRAYKDRQEFFNASKEHGPYILFDELGSGHVMPLVVENHGIWVDYPASSSGEISRADLLVCYIWQDGTPCGILEE